jgi:hypothetical protein
MSWDVNKGEGSWKESNCDLAYFWRWHGGFHVDRGRVLVGKDHLNRDRARLGQSLWWPIHYHSKAHNLVALFATSNSVPFFSLYAPRSRKPTSFSPSLDSYHPFSPLSLVIVFCQPEVVLVLIYALFKFLRDFWTFVQSYLCPVYIRVIMASL